MRLSDAELAAMRDTARNRALQMRLYPEVVTSLVTELLELRPALKPFAAMRPVSIEATATGWAVTFAAGSPQPRFSDFEAVRKALQEPT